MQDRLTRFRFPYSFPTALLHLAMAYDALPVAAQAESPAETITPPSVASPSQGGDNDHVIVIRDCELEAFGLVYSLSEQACASAAEVNEVPFPEWVSFLETPQLAFPGLRPIPEARLRAFAGDYEFRTRGVDDTGVFSESILFGCNFYVRFVFDAPGYEPVSLTLHDGLPYQVLVGLIPCAETTVLHGKDGT